jgi:hypothetical protein
LERVRGIEPLYEAWEAAVLPLNYTRLRETSVRRAGPGADNRAMTSKTLFMLLLTLAAHAAWAQAAPTAAALALETSLAIERSETNDSQNARALTPALSRGERVRTAKIAVANSGKINSSLSGSAPTIRAVLRGDGSPACATLRVRAGTAEPGHLVAALLTLLNHPNVPRGEFALVLRRVGFGT